MSNIPVESPVERFSTKGASKKISDPVLFEMLEREGKLASRNFFFLAKPVGKHCVSKKVPVKTGRSERQASNTEQRTFC